MSLYKQSLGEAGILKTDKRKRKVGNNNWRERTSISGSSQSRCMQRKQRHLPDNVPEVTYSLFLLHLFKAALAHPSKRDPLVKVSPIHSRGRVEPEPLIREWISRHIATTLTYNFVWSSYVCAVNSDTFFNELCFNEWNKERGDYFT